MTSMLHLLGLAALVLLCPASADQYCPSATDLTVAYSTPGSKNQLTHGGWINQGALLVLHFGVRLARHADTGISRRGLCSSVTGGMCGVWKVACGVRRAVVVR